MTEIRVPDPIKSSDMSPSGDELASSADVRDPVAAPKSGGCCGAAEAVDAGSVDEAAGGCCGGAERTATDASGAKAKRCCCG